MTERREASPNYFFCSADGVSHAPIRPEYNHGRGWSRRLVNDEQAVTVVAFAASGRY
jgi:hypothetical protein